MAPSLAGLVMLARLVDRLGSRVSIDFGGLVNSLRARRRPRPDVVRLLEAHRRAIDGGGCLIFFAGLALIELALIIAGLR